MDDRRRGWSLSLVIPAYNEEAGIAQAVNEADEALAALTNEYEILVVDDGSSDATATAVAAALQHRPHVRLLRHGTNRGYGAALRTGFEAAHFDRVAFTDADCQFYLDDLRLLLPLTEDAVIAVGRRVDRQDPWRRRFLSWGYNQMARALLGTGVRDVDCALKVFRKDALAELLPEARGFLVNTEMLARARQLGLKVAEAAVRHRPRLRGESKVSLGDVPRTLRSLLPFWWSRILFPGDTASGRREPSVVEPTTEGSRLPLAEVLLIVVAALLFFTRLNCPLQEPQEPRYAEIPRQMLVAGNWAVPVLHGQAYFDKPPLLYWLVMSSYCVFGVHDWAARVVPSTAGFLCVLVTYWWGRRTIGVTAAFLGALLLGLSARFVQLERLLTMDGLLCLWIVAAWAAGHVAAAQGYLRRGWWLASAVACGLGVLTKGPVALVLVLVPLLASQALDPRLARPRWRWTALYLGVVGALALPWFCAVTACDPNFAEYFFWEHNVRRFVAPFDHAEPIWFYLPALFLGMLPWSLLLPGLVAFVGKRRAEDAARRPAALGVFLLAGLWCLGFFSLAGCKRPGYVLPAMPPLALALGCYLHALLPKRRTLDVPALLRHRSRLAFRATLLTLALGVAGSLAAVSYGLVNASIGWALGGSAVAAIAGVIVVGRTRRWALPWGVCGTAAFLLLFAAVMEVLPGYARKYSVRGQVQRYAQQPESAQTPVVCYPHRWDGVSFYLRRDDVRAYSTEDRARLLADLDSHREVLVVVKTEGSLSDLRKHLPPSLEFVPHSRQGMVTVGCVRRR